MDVLAFVIAVVLGTGLIVYGLAVRLTEGLDGTIPHPAYSAIPSMMGAVLILLACCWAF